MAFPAPPVSLLYPPRGPCGSHDRDENQENYDDDGDILIYAETSRVEEQPHDQSYHCAEEGDDRDAYSPTHSLRSPRTATYFAPHTHAKHANSSPRHRSIEDSGYNVKVHNVVTIDTLCNRPHATNRPELQPLFSRRFAISMVANPRLVFSLRFAPQKRPTNPTQQPLFLTMRNRHRLTGQSS